MDQIVAQALVIYRKISGLEPAIPTPADSRITTAVSI
jgi:hypothetical protein